MRVGSRAEMSPISGVCSVGMPTVPMRQASFQIMLASSQILPRITQVERLVDERKVGHDVVHDRVFQHRPVLPRRVVQVAAQNAAARSVPGHLQRHKNFAAPAFDPAGTQAGCWGRVNSLCSAPTGSSRKMPRIRRKLSYTSSKRTATRAATSPLRPAWRA
jgi:hypothetical protein